MGVSSVQGEVTRWLINGDIEALREHLYRYRPMLREMAGRFGGTFLRRKLDGSDIVQDALQDALCGLPSVNAKSSPQLRVWLRRLLKSRISNALRKFHAAKRDVAREVYEGSSVQPGTLWVDPSQLPETELIELENLERLRKTVARLPEELQVLLNWRFEEGVTYREIGERISRSEDAVRMLVTRCLKRLKEEGFSEDSQI